jgi:hypothetical protein
VTFLSVALLSLAAYRLVRLWLYDTIMDKPRDLAWHVLSKPGRFRGWLLALLTCQWCLGVHVALWLTFGWVVVVVGWDGWSSFATLIVTWWAVAALQSWCHFIEDRLAGPEV